MRARASGRRAVALNLRPSRNGMITFLTKPRSCPTWLPARGTLISAGTFFRSISGTNLATGAEISSLGTRSLNSWVEINSSILSRATERSVSFSSSERWAICCLYSASSEGTAGLDSPLLTILKSLVILILSLFREEEKNARTLGLAQARVEHSE
uniref:Uncharacterized protein n=1 Tax=Cacopsylla melanoneura TaxID=428564 RepID=A0A8D8WW87_9HEMI